MWLATNYIDDLYFRSSRILSECNYYLDSGQLQHSINWVRFKAIQIVLQSSQVRFLECCSAIITIITRWIPWAASPSRRESAQMAELLLTPGGGAPGLRGVPYYSVPQCGVPYYRALVWPLCIFAMNIPMVGSALWSNAVLCQFSKHICSVHKNDMQCPALGMHRMCAALIQTFFVIVAMLIKCGVCFVY